jgi:DNA-binding HxlR family transcriptional regulator
MGIGTTEGITQYLGLSERIVNSQLGDLAYEGLIARVIDRYATYSLTGKGSMFLTEKGSSPSTS